MLNNNKTINPAYLDCSLVLAGKLSGWKNTIWVFWGNRAYVHNSNESGQNFISVFFIICFLATIAFFHYFPFKLMGLMVLIGFSGTFILWPIGYANQSPFIIWVNVLIGALGLVNQWQFGLGTFGYHFEKYFFWAYLIGGLLAVYRRFWNAVIWKALDKITLDYYNQHGLDFDIQTKLITDYQTAYNQLAKRFCELIKGNSHKYFTREQAQKIQNWINNRSLASFDKAMQSIDETIK
ncbi:hypothetical protein [Rickettsiella grylli]|uniref:Uncharacterized protein n=1 Tax=Rickettsiella grylli TaxID=59196 RepID=A8PLK6_9COXI|nr:hypothetical protein [Rickettsiella grylli]EDP45869.1 hypothetical protein RICGR_0457 [Rickettsiella grylli]